MRGLARFGFAAALTAALACASGAVSAAGWNGYGGSWYGSGGRGATPGWNSGHWFHGYHGARAGWWWNTGSSWYLYPQPVYPYPAYPYGGGYGYGAPTIAGDTDRTYYPAEAYSGYGLSDGTQGTSPDYTYYCARPRGFYPEVRDCDNWQQFYQGKPVTYDDERYQ